MTDIIKQLPTPELNDSLDLAKRSTKITINKVQIGIIQEFNAAQQTATVKIALKQCKSISPLGVKTFDEYPLIFDCPVFVLFGGGSFLSMPIQPGDNCIILFNDRELDNWLHNGGIETQAPTTGRVHDMSDAICLVGLHSYQQSIGRYLADGIRMSFNASSEIDIQEDAINSIAELFTHTGDMRVNGSIYVTGDWYGDNGGQMRVKTDLIQDPGHVLAAGNGASGTFNIVTVVNGIVTGGS